MLTLFIISFCISLVCVSALAVFAYQSNDDEEEESIDEFQNYEKNNESIKK